jgi:hypothetical protein
LRSGAGNPAAERLISDRNSAPEGSDCVIASMRAGDVRAGSVQRSG